MPAKVTLEFVDCPEPETSQARLATLEAKYGVSSEEFFRRYSAGEAPLGGTEIEVIPVAEARRWAVEYDINQRAKERARKT